MRECELAIIGAGPGGYVAAIRAAQKGLKATLIEKEELGGICLNWGCIPVKTILSSAELFQEVRSAKAYGIDISSAGADMAAIIKRKDMVVSRLKGGIRSILKARGVEVIKASGKLKSKNEVSIDGSDTLKAKNIIIATGSKPVELACSKFDGKDILSIRDLLDMTEIPASLAIVGGGVIGCEVGSIFNQLGSKVTIVEMADEILPTIDKEMAKRARGLFKRSGIIFKTSSKLQCVSKAGGKVTLELASGDKFDADKALICIGMTANTQALGLEELGVKTERGRILVDKHMKTSVDGIYAAGDAIGGYLLAHAASYEGIIAVENILGNNIEADYAIMPSAIFTHPEISSVGMTEDEAKEKGIDIKTGSFPFSALGRAHAAGNTDGMVKIISDKKTDIILGCHIIGPRASDLIHEIAVAMRFKAKSADIEDTIHAHPTFAEAIKEAAEAVSERSIHKL